MPAMSTFLLKRKAKERCQTYYEPDSGENVVDSASEHVVAMRKREIIKLKLTNPAPVGQIAIRQSSSIASALSQPRLGDGAQDPGKHDSDGPIGAKCTNRRTDKIRAKARGHEGKLIEESANLRRNLRSAANYLHGSV
ncbi:MAG: hypothetical protein L6R42_000321 [Xanthoria sp. 1 TBL-2021]|nr:MAG: hypothetical protein L6R42_000321 [Xanthoria sp. 1 TBL-2021]